MMDFSPPSLLCQYPMQKLDTRGALAHGCGYALDASSTYVSNRESPGYPCSEHIRLSRAWPASRGKVFRVKVGARADEAFIVERYATLHAMRVGYGARHEKDVMNREGHSLVIESAMAGYALEAGVPRKADNFRMRAQGDVGRVLDAANEVARHAVG